MIDLRKEQQPPTAPCVVPPGLPFGSFIKPGAEWREGINRRYGCGTSVRSNCAFVSRPSPKRMQDSPSDVPSISQTIKRAHPQF